MKSFDRHIQNATSYKQNFSCIGIRFDFNLIDNTDIEI